MRGHIPTGFPGNSVGYPWSGGFPGAGTVLQTTAATGIYGLSLVPLLGAARPAALGEPVLGPRRPGRRFGPAAAALLVIGVLAGAGALRLAGDSGGVVPGVRLRIVQPSIPQTLKWNPEAAESNFQRLLALSAGPGREQVTDIIWPEAAATYFLNREPARRAAIATGVPPGGLLLTRALRTDPPPGRGEHAWDSLVAPDRARGIRARHVQIHLVTV